ncbi:MAG: hypothetical protein ACE5NG_11965 [bacterium]
MKDWNIRLLLRYFRKKTDIRSFAVQRNENVEKDQAVAEEWKSVVGYWDDEKIDVYNCDALAFLHELDKLYRAEMEESKNA